MGFYTNVSISNDFWHDIVKDPKRFCDAIMVGMNEGADDPMAEALREKNGLGYFGGHFEYVRRLTPQGVTVHRAQHADVPQVICSLRGSKAIAAHEIPYAIESGWLDGPSYRADHAEAVAKELSALARDIRRRMKEAKARADQKAK